MPLVAFIAVIVMIVGLSITLWSIKRKPETFLQVKNAGDLNTLIPSIVGITQGSLEQGNKVAVLENGDGFFPLLMRDIDAARETVHIESYIWWDGQMPHQLAELLAKKARQGVEVRLLVDASGGHKMSKDTEKIMTDGGVHVADAGQRVRRVDHLGAEREALDAEPFAGVHEERRGSFVDLKDEAGSTHGILSSRPLSGRTRP